jgi:hypothetical protein
VSIRAEEKSDRDEMKQYDGRTVGEGWGQVGYGEAYRASGFAGGSWVLMDEEHCIRRTRHRH